MVPDNTWTILIKMMNKLHRQIWKVQTYGFCSNSMLNSNLSKNLNIWEIVKLII